MAGGQKVGELFVDLLLNDERFNAALVDAAAGVDKLGDPAKTAAVRKLGDAFDSIGKQLDGFADMVQNQLVLGLEAAGVAIAAFGAASLYTGANFQQAMQNVGVIADATGSQMTELTEAARQLGATTQYSATDAADAMHILASAGLEVNQILDATGSVLMLAGAGATDLETAAGAVTASMAQFNLRASDAGRIADVFAAAASRSTFEVDSLAEAMKYGGPVGASFGMTLEETTAALAQFKDLGLQGTQAGTAFRGAMVAATKDTERNREVLARYGLTMADINPELHKFDEIMQTVAKSSMTTTDTIEVFGTEAGGAIASIAAKFADGTEKYHEMLSTLETSTGAASAMYSSMTDTITGKLGEVQSGAEEMLLTVFDSYASSLKPFLQEIANFLGAVADEWKSRSGEMERGFSGVFDRLTVWLMKNREAFAEAIVDFAEGLLKIGELLAKLLPYLDDIGIAVITVFAAVRVTQFVAAMTVAVTTMGELAAAFYAGTLGVEALMAALTAATGGVYALVAGVGVLVVGLAALIYNLTGAADATKELEDAQNRTAKNAQVIADYEVAQAEKTLALTKDKIAAKLAEAQASGKLTDAMRDELTTLSGLSAEDAARMERSGELVKTAEGYRLVTEALREGGAAAAVVTEKLHSQQDALDYSAMKIAALDAALKDNANTTAGVIQQAGDEASQYVGMTVDAAFIELQNLKAHHAEVADYVKTVEKAQTASTIAEIKTRDDADAKAAERRAVAADQAAKKDSERRAAALVEYEAAAKKTADFDDAMSAELMKMRGDETEQIAAEYSRRKREIEAAYDAQVRAAKDAAKDTIEIEKAKYESLERLDEVFAAKRGEKTAEQVAQAAEAAQSQNSAQSDSMRDLQEKLAQFDVDLGDGYEKAQAAQREFSEKAGDTANNIADKVVGFALNLWKKLKEDMDKDGDGIVTRAEAISYALGKLQAAAVGFGQGVAAAMQGAFKVFEKLSGMTLDFWSILDDAKSAFDDMAAAAEEAGKRVGDVAPGIVGGGSAMGGPQQSGATVAAQGAVGDMITEAQGFITFLVQAAPVIVHELAAQLPIVGQMIVDALPGLIQSIIDELPALLNALIDIVFSILETIVKLLPDLITALLGMLPDIIRALVAAIVSLIQVIVANLPAIVTAIIEALPEIFSAIIEAIPTIIIAIVQALPTIVKELLRLVLNVIAELAKALWDAFTGLFDGKKDKDKSGGEAYAGVDYVPATMRMTVHEGERIVPAERNASRGRGANPAAPGAQRGTATGGADSNTIELSVLVDGAVVDGVVVRANAEGRATGVARMVQRATGARVGYDRGTFSYRNK